MAIVEEEVFFNFQELGGVKPRDLILFGFREGSHGGMMVLDILDEGGVIKLTPEQRSDVYAIWYSGWGDSDRTMAVVAGPNWSLWRIEMELRRMLERAEIVSSA